MNADASARRHFPSMLDGLSLQDFETASIRSAAPSYVSEAPSYHSTAPHTSEPTPPYSPPQPGSTLGPARAAGAGVPGTESASMLQRTGSPQVSSSPSPAPAGSGPRCPVPAAATIHQTPSLDAFRIPSWSSVAANPTSRLYHNVAHRRTTQAQAASSVEGMRRVLGERERAASASASASASAATLADEDQDASSRPRPLEDPYLVGEVAAARARRERLARENGDEILIREDRQWDWFLAQMRDWDDRERSFRQFRREFETGISRGRLLNRMRGRY